MRKLKLQVQITVDGFVGGPNGQLDWMTFDMDKDILKYIDDIHKPVDTILLGRKMTDGFVTYWKDVAENHPDSSEFGLAQKLVGTPKVVFTKTLEEINKLKKQDGKDIIVYGGANFVSSLIKNNLIDEYHLFVNPTAIGKGLTIFGELKNNFKLKIINSTAYECGIVVNVYKPVA